MVAHVAIWPRGRRRGVLFRCRRPERTKRNDVLDHEFTVRRQPSDERRRRFPLICID
jgi:hypothetical protein